RGQPPAGRRRLLACLRRRALSGFPVVTEAVLEGVRDLSFERPDGRIVAWSEFGDEAGLPLLRGPGTPGCRDSLRAGRGPWTQRPLRGITTERPCFGASTRLPGGGFCGPGGGLAGGL